MAFRYFVGLAGEKSFIPLTWTKPDRLSGLIINSHCCGEAHGRQEDSYEISPPVPWQRGKQLLGRLWIIERALFLFVFPLPTVSSVHLPGVQGVSSGPSARLRCLS